MPAPLDALRLELRCALHVADLPRRRGDKAPEPLGARGLGELERGRRMGGGPGADDPRLVDLPGGQPAAELAARRRRERPGAALRELAWIGRERPPVAHPAASDPER